MSTGYVSEHDLRLTPLARAMRSIRTRLELSQSLLAQRLGCSESILYCVEQGVEPTLQTFRRLWQIADERERQLLMLDLCRVAPAAGGR